LEFSSFEFSGGEIGLKIKTPRKDSRVTITTRLTSSARIMELIMATDALKRSGYTNIDLFIPYMPYARQDRVMVSGETLSIRIFADLLNRQGYSNVFTFDIHNEASLALFDNVTNEDNFSLVKEAVGKQKFVMVCPDAGALKKIYPLMRYLSFDGTLVKCDKERNVSTGEILKISANNLAEVKGKACYIVDDICDGAKTFTMIGELLKENGAKIVNLIVSHGIFSKGLNIPHIDKIHTTDSFRTISSMNDFGMRNEKYLDKIIQHKLNLF